MEEYIEKTEQKIRELNRIPTLKEWSKIAMEHKLLSATTIKAIYKTSFYSYCRKIRKS